MRLGALIAVASVFANPAWPAAPDPREIVRKCVALDQQNWLRMKDYTWTARQMTRHLDSAGAVKSIESETWETVILFGKPYRKTIARNQTPLSAADERKEQQKIDRAVAELERESPEHRAARLAAYQKELSKDREFLLEVPDAFNFRIEGEETIDGRATWIIAAAPNPAYHAKHRDAKAFRKIAGRIWIDQREFQWVRIEAKTIDAISWGWCLARLNPGASLIFEQARVNDQIWLPKREFLSGMGRLALLKKVIEEQEITWCDYRKFQVQSNLVSTR